MVELFDKAAVLFDFLDDFGVVLEDTCDVAIVLFGCRKFCVWFVVALFEIVVGLFDFLDALGVIVVDTFEEAIL